MSEREDKKDLFFLKSVKNGENVNQMSEGEDKRTISAVFFWSWIKIVKTWISQNSEPQTPNTYFSK